MQALLGSTAFRRNERGAGSLEALNRSASTSRVLNLIQVFERFGQEKDYLNRPLFRSRILNQSILLKHRLRANEVYAYPDGRKTVTKIIVPFVGNQLALGGQSMFLGQIGWRGQAEAMFADSRDMERDLRVLEVMDELPALDPFILRERLRRDGFDVAPCYFAISAGDLKRMQAFVSNEIRPLVLLACGAEAQPGEAYIARLAEALLSTVADDRMEILGKTMMLDGEALHEGLFSWKGFLYYKWVLASIRSEIDQVSGAIAGLVASGKETKESRDYIAKAKRRLRAGIVLNRRDIEDCVAVYDRAFAGLVEHNDPMVFRDFLMRAPAMFETAGHRVGVASHIVSFWNYRFPYGRQARAPIEEAVAILQDFESGLSIGV